MLFPETLRDPGFDVVESVSMRSQRFTCVRLLHPYMPCLPHDFSIMLTTAAFDRSSLWLFEASTYMATSKGLPSSLVQHDAFASSGHNAGPPLQGLPPSHTRPPRSTADHRDAASSAIFARIHAAGNSPTMSTTFSANFGSFDSLNGVSDAA